MRGWKGTRGEGRGGEGSVVESKKILKIDPGSNTQVHIDEINESVTEKKSKIGVQY